MNLRRAIAFVTSANRGIWDTDWRDLGSHVGLAYKLSDKLVFRTGYGIYFVPSLGDENPIGFSTNTPW